MDQDKQDVAQALFEAIKAEGDGQQFYLMASRSTDDPKAKQTFEQLAAEELSHQQFLRAQYKAWIATGKPDPAVTLGKPMDLSDMSPIFSPEIKSRAREAHFEMSALSIGIQLELSSMNFYKAQSERVRDPMMKALFQDLSEWETGHYQALLRQQELIKEDYWEAAGFAPF